MNETKIEYKQLGDNTIVNITHSLFSAQISLFGAQLLSFTPKGKQDILWCSSDAILDGSKAIRGGAPICWPWFGPSADGLSPQHGYARISKWKVVNSDVQDDQVTVMFAPEIEASLNSELSLNIEMVFSSSATITLITENNSATTHFITQAIHTYFNIQDINKVHVPELSNIDYIDKTKNGVIKNDPQLIVQQEVDRVYQYDKKSLTIDAEGYYIDIKGDYHDSVVIWNPWHEKAKAMADFNNDGYKQMLCVEMANTTPVKVAPNQKIKIQQTFK